MSGLLQWFRVAVRRGLASACGVKLKPATVALGVGFPLYFERILEKSFVFCLAIDTSPVVPGGAILSALSMGLEYSGSFGGPMSPASNHFKKELHDY